MAVKIVLDGRALAPSEYEAESISVTRSIEPKKDATQEIYFYGEAYELIKLRVIDAQFGQMEVLPLQIFDSCCGQALIFDGEILGKAVEFCDGECFCKAIATEKNPLLDCLKGQILSDGLQNYSHPNIPMHRDLSDFEQVVADILQILLFIFLALLVPALAAILLFLTVVELVIQGIDVLLDALRRVPLLGFIPDIIPNESRDILPDISDLPDALRAMQDLIKKIDQVYYYPSPYVRTMLENACKRCGEYDGASYTFYSPIFQQGSPYRDLVWLKASGRGKTGRTSIGIIDENKPLVSAEDFMNDLKKVFNARWGVNGNQLYIKSLYDTEGDLVDYSNENSCYSFLEEDLPARATLEYTDDPIDTTANAEKGRFDHLQEFANNSTPALRGKKQYILPFGRFLVEPFRGKFSASSSRMLKMARTSCGVAKLMIFKDGQPTDGTEMLGATLWASFFYNESPLSISAKRRRFEVTADYECDKAVEPSQPILLSLGSGIVEEVTIDYTGRTITIIGTV